MTSVETYVRVIGRVAVVSPEAGVIQVSPTQRTILAQLVVREPATVPWEGLAQAVWGDDPPETARAAVQNQISRIRAMCVEHLIDTHGDGYALAARTDLAMLRDAATTAQAALARPGDTPSQDRAGLRESAEKAFLHLDGLLEGAGVGVLSGVEASSEVSTFRHSAEITLAAAASTRLELAVLAGRWAWALIEGERLTAELPGDERIAANYARALALAGRRGDALAWLTEVRQSLRIELGVGPGPELDAAETEILRGTMVGSSEELESTTEARLSSVPFLGRDNEMRHLLQAVAQNRTAQVIGDYGSGVSRILAEARARLTSLGVRTILVRAEEHPQSAMSLLEQLLFEWDVVKEPSQNPLSAFSMAVASLEASTPTVFIIDDVQFVGPSTRQALRVLAQAERGGLIVGGHRSVFDLGETVEIAVEPFDLDTSKQLVQHWGINDEDRVEHVVATATGNPLAIELLARDLRNRPDGQLPPAAPAGASRFNDFLQRSIDQLSADHAQDLQLAAVAGDGFPHAALELIDWGHDRTPPASLVDVDTHGLLRFRFGGLQHYVYETIARGVRLDMHHALGHGARHVGAPASTVARHLLAAADLDPDGAIDAARSAAQESSRLGAHADAADWLAQALAVARGHDGHANTRPLSLAIEHADALRLSGDPEHLDLLKEAAHHAVTSGDEQLVSQAGFALLQLGGSSSTGNLGPDAVALADTVIETISDPQLRAPVQAAASLAWSMTGNAEKARALFDAAEASATSVPARLKVLPFAYLAVGRPSDLGRRIALAQELVTLATAAAEPVALWEGLHLTFTVALQRADGPLLRRTLRDMEAMIDSIGDIGRRWSTQYCAAAVAQLDGDLERSQLLAEQAYAAFAPVSPERAAAAYFAQLLPLRIAQDRLDELRPLVMGLVQEQPEITGWHAAAALMLATDTHADDAHVEMARRHSEQALLTAQDDFTWLATHVIGGRAAALLSDADLIERYNDRLQPWAHLVCWQGTCSYGPVADVLAELAIARGDTAAAQRHRSRAATLHATLTASAPSP